MPIPQGKNALMIAASNDKPNIVKRLLKAGANVNQAIVADGHTALSIASEQGHTDVVRVLLRQPQVGLNNFYRSSLMLAATKGHVDIVELLLQHEAMKEEFSDTLMGPSALILAAENNRLDVVVRLVDAMTKFDGPVLRGNEALKQASMNGHFEIVELLLSRGVDPNEPSGDNNSALLIAAERGHFNIVRLLIESGANVNKAGGELKDTALVRAAEAGCLDVVELLSNSIHIELDKTDSDGKSAMVRAAFSNHPDVVACLLDAGASIKAGRQYGTSALQHMLNAGYGAVVEVLLAKKVKLDDGVFDFFPQVRTPFDTTVADLCAEAGGAEFVPPAIEEAENFFKELIDTLCEETGIHRRFELRPREGILSGDIDGQPTLKWLRTKGIRMACARLVLAALNGASARWKKNGANEQQKMNYCLAALNKLISMGEYGKALAPYRQAKVSPAARTRLAVKAEEQLVALHTLAADTFASIGSRMANELIATCMAATNMYGKVDVVALEASLHARGYFRPVAVAISQSWRTAIKKLQSSMPISTYTNIKPDATFKTVMKPFKAHGEQHAPVLFAQELMVKVAQRELTAELEFELRGDRGRSRTRTAYDPV